MGYLEEIKTMLEVFQGISRNINYFIIDVYPFFVD